MKQLNVYKVRYDWYEGEWEEDLVITILDVKEFSTLMKEILKNLSEMKEEEYEHDVKCLETAYHMMLDEMLNAGCVVVGSHPTAEYRLHDSDMGGKFYAETKKVFWGELE